MTSKDDETPPRADVVVVGDGPAGLTAGLFTGRNGLRTTVLGTGASLLRRNAHLENFPGFPAGVNSRLLLDAMCDQAERAGCDLVEAEVVRVERTDDGFTVETAVGAHWKADYVVAATKNAVDYLDDEVELMARGKPFVVTDDRGRTSVPGLYAAGRIAGKPHQAVVAAGHGAEVGTTILEDDERPFYHDWVAPDRYFTGRGREVPPGCEEIPEAERREREQASRETMQAYFAEPHPDRPEQHPSVEEE